MPKLTKDCRNCAKPFRLKPSEMNKKFCCSLKCKYLYRRNSYTGPTKPCLYCKQTFRVKPSNIDKKSYCSRSCMSLDYQQRLRGEDNPNYENVGWKKCLRCNSTFHSYNKNRAYCSFQCSYIPRPAKQLNLQFRGPRLCRRCGAPCPHRRYCQECTPRNFSKAIQYTCQHCGKPVTGYKQHPRVSCSRQCYGVLVAQRQKGEKSHLWQGGKTSEATLLRGSREYKAWRTGVFTRDNWTCQMCQQRGGKLAAHHIIEFAKRRELALVVENGITLCWPCHHSIHHYEEQYAAQFLAITGGSSLLEDACPSAEIAQSQPLFQQMSFLSEGLQ